MKSHIDIKNELRALQANDLAPKWMHWIGYQMLKGGYLLDNETPKDMFTRIAYTAASHLPSENKEWEDKFFNLFWDGFLCGSTPVLSNMGTNRGMAVSCSASYVGDSMHDIAYTNYEIAMLSKNGFGTAAFLDLRPGHSPISTGGFSNSIVDWIETYWKTSHNVSQGGVRRGSVALYIDFWHDELLKVLPMMETHGKLNLGITCDARVKEALKANDPDALERYREIMTWRARKGKPYIVFLDNFQKQDPVMYKELGLSTKHSNLCSEIGIHTDTDHTLSCVLSSMNGAKFLEWKDTDAVFNATIFLDCVAEDLIQKGQHLPGLERVVRSTRKGRPLGLGLLGFHTFLQEQGIPMNSILARGWNNKMFTHIKEESLRASKHLAEWLGEPEWCKGHGVRNTHLLAIAPNVSSSLIAGTVSPGIEPMAANVFMQKVSKGTVKRINPVLLKILRKRNKYTDEVVNSIAFNKGSVQHLNFLTEDEKEVFKTAYEINQKTLIDLAEQRQEHICQAQSLNLFFSKEESEERIHEVHKYAFEQERLKSLYYVRTMAGITGDNDDGCKSCD